MNQQKNDIIERPEIRMALPAKHLKVRLVRASETYILGSRGSLKTTVADALYMIDCVYDMPRHTGVVVVPNYEHWEINTKPALLKGLKQFGFHTNIHFVVGEAPPESWAKPYDFDPALKYNQVMTWHNGTQYIVVSLARIGAANAISAQSGIFDEVKLMPKAKLDEVFPIFRGNEKYFSHTSNLFSKIFTTDKLADPAEITWLLNKRQQVDHQKVADVIALQMEVNKLKALLPTVNKTRQNELKFTIFRYEQLLKKERTGMVYVEEINCYDVRAVLGEQWFQTQKAQVKSKRVWEVAYENKDPDKPAESFYPSFDTAIHGYECSTWDDVDFDKPFIIAADYQHSVAPIPVDQLTRLPWNDKVSKNTIDYIYTLAPGTLKEAVQKFCDSYSSSCREVYYVYDHTAIGKRANAESFDTIVRDTLTANGWRVYDVYIGDAPDHFDKYNRTDEWLKHTDPDNYQLFINVTRCPNLVKSIEGSGTKISLGKTKKEKKFENTHKYPDLDQSTTTHGSDAWDMINEAVMNQKLIKESITRVRTFGFR